MDVLLTSIKNTDRERENEKILTVDPKQKIIHIKSSPT